MARNHTSFVAGDRRAGRPKGSRNKVTEEVQDLARRLLNDPAYQANLRKRLIAGEAGPIEVVLFYFAYGKPVDRVRIAGDDGPLITGSARDPGPLGVRLQERMVFILKPGAISASGEDVAVWGDTVVVTPDGDGRLGRWPHGIAIAGQVY
jgi:hypothetical protein